MSFIYDILLNFNDEEILDVYEWEKSDDIYRVRKIVLFKVKNNQLKELIGNNVVLSKDLLNSIYNKGEIIINKKLKKIPYMALFTDSNDVIAIKFNELGKSISKSFLLFDEEAEVIDFSNHIQYTNIDYQIISKCHKELLTRSQVVKLNELKEDIKRLFNKGEHNILKYYYYECLNESNDDVDEVYRGLLEIINSKDEEKFNSIYQINQLIKSKDRLSS